MNLWNDLKNGLRGAAARKGLLAKTVTVRGRALLPVEALGEPEHDDYPILKGREQMLEIEVGEGLGHAFTDGAGTFAGTVEDILALAPDAPFRRALLVACLNAVLRGEPGVEKTRHCTDAGPVECAKELPARVEALLAEHGKPADGRARIFQAGLQPRMAEALAARFEVRITDLDPDNIGTRRAGVLVESPERTAGNLRWCDAAVVTGTVLTSGTLEPFLDAGVPALFYGVTVAGAAQVLGLQRFCPRST